FPELRGKAEIFVGTHPLHPLAGSLRNGRPVKAEIDLNRIEKIRDVGELVELGRLRFWINDPLPVLVHPSSRSESHYRLRSPAACPRSLRTPIPSESCLWANDAPI